MNTTTLNPQRVAKEFLSLLQDTLTDIYGENVKLANVDARPNGVVTGIFVASRKPFEFTLINNEASYKQLNPKPTKLDSTTASHLQTLADIPIPLGDDAYSSGFLSVWHTDARKCTIGTRCGGSCISASDECRIRVSRPATQRKLKSLVDGAKLLHKLGASGLLLPLLGVAAVGVVGFGAGLSLGQFMGESSTAKTKTSQLENNRAPAKTTTRTRKKKFTPEEIPDPWREDAAIAQTLARVQKQIQQLIRESIASINPSIVGLPSVSVDDRGTITGKFRAKGTRILDYTLTPSNELRIKETGRFDSEQDDCTKGNPCKGQCIPRSNECIQKLQGRFARNADRARTLYATAQRMASESKGGKAVGELITEAIDKGEIPSRRRIAGAIGKVTLAALKDPVGEFKRGREREKLVLEAIEIATEESITHKKVIRQGASRAKQRAQQFIKNNPDKVEEAVVGLSGFTASQVGAALGGPVGEKAADLVGSVSARKAIRDYRALKGARAKLSDDKDFKNASRIKKLGMLRDATLEELKRNREKTEDDTTGDVAGWVAGNSGGDVAASVGRAAGIPLTGAVGGISSAMAVSPKIVEARKRIKQGEARSKVIAETAKEIASTPKKRIEQARRLIQEGNEREAKLRQKLNTALKNAKFLFGANNEKND